MFSQNRLAPACIALATASAVLAAPSAANAAELQFDTRSEHSVNAAELSSGLVQPYRDLSSQGSSEYFFPSPENRNGNRDIFTAFLAAVANLALPFFVLLEITGSSVR